MTTTNPLVDKLTSKGRAHYDRMAKMPNVALRAHLVAAYDVEGATPKAGVAMLVDKLDLLADYRRTVDDLTARLAARSTDPSTSVSGAEDIDRREGSGSNFRAKSQKAQLLAEFARHPEGLTSYEAAEPIGLTRPGCCYWHRVGDLDDVGMLETTGEERKSPITGLAGEVRRITDIGWDKLRQLGIEVSA